MFKMMFEKAFGTKHEREIKRLKPHLAAINGHEELYRAKSDDELRATIALFRQKLQTLAKDAKDHKELRRIEENYLAEILPDVFAIVREAGRRVLGMRHYDVQMIGGMVLHSGRIAEMKTGEGKTLVATLPLVLNAITGRGAQLVTVNDYLARRDSEWMGRIYKFLGFSVGLIVHGLENYERREAYNSDIIYGTNNEFGFDYLRDNMKFTLADYVQRDLHFAIVDEVDSILIDEARTPLIISGQGDVPTELYHQVNGQIKHLVALGLKEGKAKAAIEHKSLAEVVEEQGGMRAIANSLKGKEKKDLAGDYYYYSIDEKGRNVILSDEGVAWVERHFGITNLYDPQYVDLVHHIGQAMRAHLLYHNDQEYIVNEEGKVIIVDEFTGRLMPGRRWSDGLHQAIEAKEGVTIESENQTLATITFQNYFRMYDKLAGMTGTAETEAQEFKEIYGLNVVAIPTNQPMIRIDAIDQVYRTKKEKLNAIVDEISKRHANGQPVLVGTITIESSEQLSALLKKRGVKHNVLNAKFHEKEAEIVAQAGRLGAVTIATNMAGRGTDIVLGGNPEFLAWLEVGHEAPLDVFQAAFEQHKGKCKEEKPRVLAAGGLHILGTERHESRRIDNQLRGRSGRQGDPGSSSFYLALEDDLMRIFGGERLERMMKLLRLEEGEVIEHPWISKSIESAQKRVENHNFDIRKTLLDYDMVMNEQRTVIYRLRRAILEGKGQEERIFNAIEDVVLAIVGESCVGNSPEKWELDHLAEDIRRLFGVEPDLRIDSGKTTPEEMQSKVYFQLEKAYRSKSERINQLFGDGGVKWAEVQRELYLQRLDKQWREHLSAMDHLREGIGLRGYGSKDPKYEYKKEGLALFEDLLYRISEEVVRLIFHVQVQTEEEVQAMHEKQMAELERKRQEAQRLQNLQGPAQAPSKAETQQRREEKVGRNDPCPCGSGQKFKKCHWGKPGFERFQ